MDSQTKIIIGVVVVIAIAIVIYKYSSGGRKENFLRLRSEPNLNCDLGAVGCRLSTGEMGQCDYANMDRNNFKNRECVELPYNSPLKEYNNGGINEDLQVYSLSSAIGELSAECTWRGICTRSDNSGGYCVSGLCYPMSQIAESY